MINPHRTWKQAWADRGFIVSVAASLVALVVVVNLFATFLGYVEARPGAVLDDPVLRVLPPLDVTWVTFSLIYASVLIAVWHLGHRPDRLLLAFHSYIIMVLARMVAMHLLPLDPPADMIPLKDPFVESLVGDGDILTKDLFFSGHTSTMFLLALTASTVRMRLIFLVATLAVGYCVIRQHVHYSVDVFAAPFFAYGAYRVVSLLHDLVAHHRGHPLPSKQTQ